MHEPGDHRARACAGILTISWAAARECRRWRTSLFVLIRDSTGRGVGKDCNSVKGKGGRAARTAAFSRSRALDAAGEYDMPATRRVPRLLLPRRQLLLQQPSPLNRVVALKGAYICRARTGRMHVAYCRPYGPDTSRRCRSLRCLLYSSLASPPSLSDGLARSQTPQCHISPHPLRGVVRHAECVVYWYSFSNIRTLQVRFLSTRRIQEWGTDVNGCASLLICSPCVCVLHMCLGLRFGYFTPSVHTGRKWF